MIAFFRLRTALILALSLALPSAVDAQIAPDAGTISRCAAVEPTWTASSIAPDPQDVTTSLAGAPLRVLTTITSSPMGTTEFYEAEYDYSGSLSADSGAARSGSVQIQLQQGSNFGATTRSEFHIAPGAYTEFNLLIADAEWTSFTVRALDSTGQPLAAANWSVASYEQDGTSPASAPNHYTRFADRLAFASSADSGFSYQDDDAVRIRFDAVTLASAVMIVLETERNAHTSVGGDFMEYMVSACAARDFSDAPASYGAPWHATGTPHRLGNAGPDTETAAQPGTDADGDDTASNDDEDGVTLPVLSQGNPATITVEASRPLAQPGYLSAWIDWNGDGDFDDAGEQVAADQNLGGDFIGIMSLAVAVPADATLARTYARFRWGSTAGQGPTAPANDGEVEDYALTILPTARLVLQKTAIIAPSSPFAYAVPGAQLIYTISVANHGAGQTDGGTLLIVDALPGDVVFHNGDPDGAGPLSDPVSFDPGTSGLSLTPASDVRFSNGTTHPATIAECNYVPAAGDDPAVRYICVTPGGTMAAGDPPPTFSLTFRGSVR